MKNIKIRVTHDAAKEDGRSEVQGVSVGVAGEEKEGGDRR